MWLKSHKLVFLNKLPNFRGVTCRCALGCHPSLQAGSVRLEHLWACSCVAEGNAVNICTFHHVWLSGCWSVCVKGYNWLIPQSGATWPDGVWCLAVFVVTKLMMSFMKFIDPICMTPRVCSPVPLSVVQPLSHCSRFMSTCLPLMVLRIPRAHTKSVCLHFPNSCTWWRSVKAHKLPIRQTGHRKQSKLFLLIHSALIYQSLLWCHLQSHSPTDIKTCKEFTKLLLPPCYHFPLHCSCSLKSFY